MELGFDLRALYRGEVSGRTSEEGVEDLESES